MQVPFNQPSLKSELSEANYLDQFYSNETYMSTNRSQKRMKVSTCMFHQTNDLTNLFSDETWMFGGENIRTSLCLFYGSEIAFQMHEEAGFGYSLKNTLKYPAEFI